MTILHLTCNCFHVFFQNVKRYSSSVHILGNKKYDGQVFMLNELVSSMPSLSFIYFVLCPQLIFAQFCSSLYPQNSKKPFSPYFVAVLRNELEVAVKFQAQRAFRGFLSKLIKELALENLNCAKWC